MLKSEYGLSNYNTFKVDVKAKLFFEFKTSSDLSKLFNAHNIEEESVIVLGGGSNILFKGDYDGVVLHSVNDEFLIEREDRCSLLVRGYAGLEWDKFVGACVKKGFVGLSPLSLIPGSVGASPVQNIGAYGAEASQYIEEVECFDIYNKEVVVLGKEACQFSYRDSVFKRRQGLVVVSVVFRLYKSEKHNFESITSSKLSGAVWLQKAFKGLALAKKSLRFGSSTNWHLKMNFDHFRELIQLPIIPSFIKRKMVVFIRQRNMPDPKKVANVGCFFKSPVINREDARLQDLSSEITLYGYGHDKYKVSAGDLLKSCGLQGSISGGVGMDENRPLILIKYENVSGQAIYDFSQNIVETVLENTGIRIEPEVVIV